MNTFIMNYKNINCYSFFFLLKKGFLCVTVDQDDVKLRELFASASGMLR